MKRVTTKPKQRPRAKVKERTAWAFVTPDGRIFAVRTYRPLNREWPASAGYRRIQVLITPLPRSRK